METILTIEALQYKISFLKKENKTIGFVPTMGALHKGHISLIDRSVKENDFTVSSLFVNPTQFNNPEDLGKYPRTFEADSNKLETAKCDFLFAPSTQEMYPEKDNREFDFGSIATVMEGKHRPGHFNGVAQIVSKLFVIVKPTRAYFGEKDFQQLAIVSKLNNDYLKDLQIEIVACKIIREDDGLAMSSRNMRLNVEQRKNASLISKTLFETKTNKDKLTVENLKKMVGTKINKNQHLELEYFDIVDNKNLTSVKNWEEKNIKVACIAVFCGKVRLIDNVVL